MKYSFRVTTFLLSCILLLSTIAISQTKSTLKASDFYKIKNFSDAQISPDGNWFLYSLTTIDSAKDNRNTDIYMTSWNGNENIQLTNSPEGESNAKWSPDGKYISFVAARTNGSSQVYLLNRLGGEAQKLTDVKGDLNDYAWSPDSKKLVLNLKDPIDSLNKKQPWVINKYKFKQDVTGYAYDNRKTHLYLFTIESKKLDTLTKGMYNESGMQWSPDGSKIAFVSNRTEDPDKNVNTDIFIIDAKPGAAEKQITSWKGSDSQPRWSPDGKSIAYLQSTSNENYIMYDQAILATISVDGSTIPKLISKALDRPISNHKWNKTGDKIYCLVSDDCEKYVGEYTISNQSLKKLQSGARSFSNIEVHPDGSLLTLMSNPTNPNEYYSISTTNTLKKLTKVHDELVATTEFSTVEKVQSLSRDGAQVSNLYYKPMNTTLTSKHPGIFFIHGGPVAQDELGFDFTRQYLASQGYAVVAVNYRGSNGKGINFSKAIYADWGNKEVLDIQGAANHFISKGIIDSNKLGIGGWSYGGILTDYTIAKDNRFKAAISGAGSALQLSLYGVDQYILQLDNELGQPWKDKNYEKYLNLSYPFLNADKIKTPTLFMTGEKDFNVPAIGSEQMYQALRSIGTPTELIVYPGQFHGFTTPSYILDRYQRYSAWFDKYLKREKTKS